MNEQKSPQTESRPPDRSSATTRQPVVELNIEDIVLHGFAPAASYRFGEAIERELGRLFAEQGIPAWMTREREVSHPITTQCTVSPQAEPEAIGVQIARAIMGDLSNE
jgi:hypothetical protein